MANQPGVESSEIVLRDGRKVTIRPVREDDYDALHQFGMALPKDDWLYLDVDLQNANTIKRLVTAAEATNWRQLVVVDGKGVMGYSNIRQLPGWQNHVGDIHLVVSSEYRQSGLGSELAKATITAGRDLGVSKLLMEMLTEQSAGRTIFERLGFELEGTLKRQARDYQGQDHDLLIFGYHL
ncbi:MAG: GNAT family N-acetyltransferase [Herpetosiphon sp.]